MKVCSPHLGHMIKMAATPIYGKTPLRIFFFGTKGPVAFELDMQHWGQGPNKIEKNYSPRLTLTFAMEISFFFFLQRILWAEI